MDDVLALDVGLAGPGDILLPRRQRRAHRVDARNEEAVFAQHVQHRATHPGHDLHIDHDVGAVGDFDADLGDGRTERTHAERDDVHRAAAHAAVEQTVQGRAHFRRRRPVVGRAGVLLVDRADEGAVLDPADIGRVRAREIGVGPLFRIKADERPPFDHQVAQSVVFFLRAIAPDDLLRLA